MPKRTKKLLIIGGAAVAAALLVCVVGFKLFLGVVLPSRGVTCSFYADDERGVTVLQTTKAELVERGIVPGSNVAVQVGYGADFSQTPALSGPYLNSCADYVQITDDEVAICCTADAVPKTTSAAKPEQTITLSVWEPDKYAAIEAAGTATAVPKSDALPTKYESSNLRINLYESTNTSASSATKSINLLNDFGIKNLGIKNKENIQKILKSINSIVDSGAQNVCICSGQNYDTASCYCMILECLAGASYDELQSNYRNFLHDAYGLEPYSKDSNTMVEVRLNGFLHTLTKTPSYTDLHKLDYCYYGEVWLRSLEVPTSQIEKIQTYFSK